MDASLDVDLHDGRVRAGHDIQMANGPVIVKCGKLQKVSFSRGPFMCAQAHLEDGC